MMYIISVLIVRIKLEINNKKVVGKPLNVGYWTTHVKITHTPKKEYEKVFKLNTISQIS
jgi:hypothetical protein